MIGKQHLPLAPFGRILLAYQAETIKLDQPIYIFVGHGAKDEAYAQKRMGTLCSFLPAADDPSRYNWPIGGQKVILCDNGGLSEIQLRKIIFNLMQYNPRILYLWSMEHPCQFFNGEKNER